MKPSPPDTLLARGQAWTVVEAPWGLLPGPFKDNQFTCTGYQCDQVGIIYNLDPNKFLTETLCEEHMGFHRWIQDGKVMQWKADPVYVNKIPKVRIPGRRNWLV